MKTADYWRQRFEGLEERMNGEALKFDKKSQSQFNHNLRQLEDDLNKWYGRFAENEGISLEEARKRMNAGELAEFKWTVKEYIKRAKENELDGRWIKQLENASARVHIRRYEQLFLSYRQHIEELYKLQDVEMTELLEGVYLEQYNRVAYIVQTGTNVGFALATTKKDQIQAILNKPWALDGKNFSERIWDDKNKLIATLEQDLTRAFALGQSPRTTAMQLSKRMGVSFRNAVRLVNTEQAAFSAIAQEHAFKELDVDRYEVIATLDSKTSDICIDMDLKVFDMSEYKIGSTAPPFHVRCRSTTAPKLDDDDEYPERVARDKDGKTIYVPGNMSYKEWKEKYGKEVE